VTALERLLHGDDAPELPTSARVLATELLVGLDDDAARHAETACKEARRWQGGISREPSSADPVAYRRLDLAVQGHAVVALELDQDIARRARIGPLRRHRIGS
jgi:hypothetical protein